MIRWNKENIREELLRTGMGCFVFGAGMTLLNVLVLPVAKIRYHRVSCWIAFFAALAVCVILKKWMSRMPERRLEGICRIAVPVFVVALFVLQIVLGYCMEYAPSGDNFAVYEGSRMLAENGCFDENTGFELYFARFPNQWGFLLFCTAIRKLCAVLGVENIFMALVVVQAFLYVLGVLSMLNAAQKYAGGVRSELMLLAMLITCLPLYLASGVLYTDTFSMPFVPITLKFALDVIHEKRRNKRIVLVLACGAAATIGGMIKMTVWIMLIAVIICWLLMLKPRTALVYSALCILIVAVGSGVVKQAILSAPVSSELHAQHNTPKMHWIEMSIPSSGNEYGGYNSYDYAVTWGMMEEGASRQAVMSSIYSRMKDKIYTLRYPNRLIQAALRKNFAAFGDGTFGMSEMLDDNPVRENWISGYVLKGRRGFPVYQGITSGIYYAYFLLAVWACIRDIRKHDVRMAMGYIAVFGMMLFLMFWEARTRYFFGFIPIVLLLGSICTTKRNEENVL